MWVYEKKLQYPVNIKQTNPKLAKIIISQYGGLYCKKIYNKSPARNLKSLQAVLSFTFPHLKADSKISAHLQMVNK